MLTKQELDKPIELSVIGTRCAYLNNFRLAGGKPWGGSETTANWKNVSLRDVIRAFPELQRELGFDYLGNAVTNSVTA